MGVLNTRVSEGLEWRPKKGISIQKCAPQPFYCTEKISLKINRGEMIQETACARLSPSRWNRPPGDRVHQRRGVALVPRFIVGMELSEVRCWRLAAKVPLRDSLTSAAEAATESRRAIAAVNRCATQNQLQHRFFPRAARTLADSPEARFVGGATQTETLVAPARRLSAATRAADLLGQNRWPPAG
jgi:hypothetical protein